MWSWFKYIKLNHNILNRAVKSVWIDKLLVLSLCSESCAKQPDLYLTLLLSLRYGTRMVAHHTSPMNTPSSETPCHPSHLLLSTRVQTPQLERYPWRWGVSWPLTAAFTTRQSLRASCSQEVQRGRRAKRPTRCMRSQQPSTVTRMQQLPQNFQVGTVCDTIDLGNN